MKLTIYKTGSLESSSGGRTISSVQDLIKDEYSTYDAMKLVGMNDTSVYDWLSFPQEDTRVWKSVQLCRCSGEQLGIVFERLIGRVETLTVEDCPLSDTVFHTLAKGIAKSKTLIRLSFTYINFSSAQGASLAIILTECQQLRHLSLHRCSFYTPEAKIVLTSGFAKNKTLGSLIICACRISDKYLSVWIAAMEHHPKLKRIFLQDYIGNRTLCALGRLLDDTMEYPKLKQLGLKNVAPPLIRHSPGLPKLLEALQHNTTVTEVEFRGNFYCDEDPFPILAKVLRYNTTLQSLVAGSSKHISNNSSKRMPDVSKVSRGFLNTTLQNLSLSGNGITEDEVVHGLSMILPQMSRLKRLSLRRNPIGPRGIAVLMEALKNHRHPLLGGLECLCLPRHTITRGNNSNGNADHENNDDNDEASYLRQIQHQTSLNRSGWWKLVASERPIPLGLWSKALERAGKMSYYNREDKWKSPTDHTMRFTVIYGFLRNAPMIFEGRAKDTR